MRYYGKIKTLKYIKEDSIRYITPHIEQEWKRVPDIKKQSILTGYIIKDLSGAAARTGSLEEIKIEKTVKMGR